MPTDDVTLAKYVVDALKDVPALVNALRTQRQIDMDGDEVAVSRQACDYAAALIEHYAALRTPAPAVAQETAAARDVLAERARQVSAEEWTPAHDDAHTGSELALAASGYALSAARRAKAMTTPAMTTPPQWPWEAFWWKPTTPRRDLVKAGALILAEIERLDRATPPTEQPAASAPGRETK